MKNDIIALDIGTKRIGVARANIIAKLPQPLPALANDNTLSQSVKLLINTYKPDCIVVGLPRNLSGEETKQTAYTKQFVIDKLPKDVKIVWQDETLSSIVASERTGKTKELDSEAACLILEDYFKEQYDVSQ